MGAAYYIVLEKEVHGVDTMMDGKTLFQNIETLDLLAEELGVRPLSEFSSMDASALDEILGDDAPGEEIPPLEQFSAKEGLASVQALLQKSDAQIAFQDLKDCERILTAAAREKIRWHFQIDF